MKLFKSYFFLAFLSVGLFVVGCKDEVEPDLANVITITIDEPMSDEVISMDDCGGVHIHVDIMASDENHEVEIVLHPEGDVEDKIIDFDKHSHDEVITFEQEVDLCSYGAGACFHLEVSANIDHDGNEKETADVEFCLQ